VGENVAMDVDVEVALRPAVAVPFTWLVPVPEAMVALLVVVVVTLKSKFRFGTPSRCGCSETPLATMPLRFTLGPGDQVVAVATEVTERRERIAASFMLKVGEDCDGKYFVCVCVCVCWFLALLVSDKLYQMV
jgi:hypothetical protein